MILTGKGRRQERAFLVEDSNVKTQTMCQQPAFSNVLVPVGERSTEENETVSFRTRTRASFLHIIST